MQRISLIFIVQYILINSNISWHIKNVHVYTTSSYNITDPSNWFYIWCWIEVNSAFRRRSHAWCNDVYMILTRCWLYVYAMLKYSLVKVDMMFTRCCHDIFSTHSDVRLRYFSSLRPHQPRPLPRGSGGSCSPQLAVEDVPAAGADATLAILVALVPSNKWWEAEHIPFHYMSEYHSPHSEIFYLERCIPNNIINLMHYSNSLSLLIRSLNFAPWNVTIPPWLRDPSRSEIVYYLTQH